MEVTRGLGMVLGPLSLFYGAYVRRRAWLYAKGWLKQKRLNATVISVGNLTVGGTGKTPMVLWLAQKFLALMTDRKSTRLNSSHQIISYAVFCLKKKID